LRARQALHQHPPLAGEHAQIALRLGGHEAGPDQAMAGERGQPIRIRHVGLAPRHGLDVVGIGQDQRDAALKGLVHGQPVDPGALQRDMGDAVFGQPVCERGQILAQGAEAAPFAAGLGSSAAQQQAGHQAGLMHVEPGGPFHHDVHDHLLGTGGRACAGGGVGHSYAALPLAGEAKA